MSEKEEEMSPEQVEAMKEALIKMLSSKKRKREIFDFDIEVEEDER